MPFAAEDGTIVEDANSLCSVEFADEYFSDRGITAWAGADESKQSWLIRATDYFVIRFGSNLKGYLVEDDQPLPYPRSDIGMDDTVPTAIKKAIAEYGLRAKSSELAPDPVATETGRLGLISESHETGPIKDTYRYASRGSGTPPPPFRPYPAADALIWPFLNSSSGVVR